MIVEYLTGTAGELHSRPLSAGPASLAFCEVTRPSIVLGSSQRDEILDVAAVGRSGVEVARRRGGGGAVWLAPGVGVWFDLEISATDPRWDADVGRAFLWVGEMCAAALRKCGITAKIHGGPLVSSRWSSRVCFAGVGAGELTVDGRKLVGVSQRRTRDRARFMVQVYGTWDAVPLVAHLALDEADRQAARRDLATVATGLVDLGSTTEHFVTELVMAARHG
jgi:lipoate-protein ligase A